MAQVAAAGFDVERSDQPELERRMAQLLGEHGLTLGAMALDGFKIDRLGRR